MSYCSDNVGVDQYATTIAEFTGTKAADGVFCFLTDQIGVGLFLLTFFGVAFVSIIIFSETLALPIVLAVLVSVTLLPALPGVGVSFFGGVLALLFAAGVLWFFRRLERNTQ